MPMVPYEPPFHPILLPIIVDTDRSHLASSSSGGLLHPGWVNPYHYRPDWFSARNFFNSEMAVDRSQSDPNNFSCSFNLHGFAPSDVKIKTIGNKVVVDAEREDNHDEEKFHSYSKRQFHRYIMLPENVNVDQLTSSLSGNGVLKLKAPYLSLPSPGKHESDVAITVEKVDPEKNN